MGTDVALAKPAAVRVAPTGELDPDAVGVVFPVFGAHPQAGTSGVALALADAAALAGLRVQLIDSAEPARSGLVTATQADGRSWPVGDDRGSIRLASRSLGRAVVSVRRIVSTGPPLGPWAVPRPVDWVAREPWQVDVTIVDLGWDMWRVMAPQAGLGPLEWCVLGNATVHPILVMRATLPSVSAAELILHRYGVGVERAGLTPVQRLAVAGAGGWPDRVRGATGNLVEGLAHDAVFLPHDPVAAVEGWTAAPTPPASSRPAATILRGFGDPFAVALAPASPGRRPRLFHRN
ncbi:hypothetical protein [Actinoplanes sp. NPDC051494]|uniref:hypothetical protein n=1 Tax=Actinoplanes sp. NPDC051494 TaxID=3363907 RepID=UPI0037A6ADD4